MFDLETNEHVQKAVNDRQMPKVEYRKIEIDDYRECRLLSSQRESRESPLWCSSNEPA